MAMTQAKPTKLGFAQTLVLHAITGRAVHGVAVVTDRLIGEEVALTPSTVRDVRRDLQVAGLIEARVVATGRVEADDELVILLLALEKAAVP